MVDPPKSEDEKRRDEILKRMLKTPPKPHDSGRDKESQDEKPKKPKD